MGTHIVLFLKPTNNINFNKLATDMYNNYKELGHGICIEKEVNRVNEPNIIFNSNNELLVDINYHHIALNIYGEYTKIKEDIMEMLWDAFDLNDLEFAKIGYRRGLTLPIANALKFKNDYFKNPEALQTEEFEFSYHTNINFNQTELICWKNFTNFRNEHFIISYDISNKDDANVTYKYTKDFLNYSDNYIDNEIKKMEE